MTSKSKPKVIVIYRVSTDEQADKDRAGLPRQREAVARVVKHNDLEVISEIELVGLSGTNVGSSPEFCDMLRKVRSREIDGVAVSSLDRLARPGTFEDMAILDSFAEARATIYADGEVINIATKEGRLTAQVKMAFHGYDRSNIVERSATAKEIKRRKGECPGPPNILPLGVAYDRKSDKWSYTPEIETVKDAFRLFDKEKITNISQLARKVGLQRNTLSKILRNPLYKGWRIYDQKRGEEKYVVKNPRAPLKKGETVRFARKKVARKEDEIIRVQVIKKPAINPEVFDRVQVKLAENRQAWQRENVPAEINLARGIGFCAHCGSRLYAASGRRRGGKHHGYYLCAKNHYLNKRKGLSCRQPNVRKHVLDELLTVFAAEHLASESVIHAIAKRLKEPVDNESSKANQKRRLKQIDEESGRILGLYQKGIVPIEELEKVRKKLDQEKSAIERRLLSYDEQERLRSRCDKSVALLYKACLAFRGITSLAQKQSAFRGLFAKVFFDGERIVGFVPMDADLRPIDDGGEMGAHLEQNRGIMKGCIRLDKPFVLDSYEKPMALVLKGHKCCRICEEVLPLGEFRIITTKKGTWHYYACKECSKQLMREAYQRRKKH